MIHTWHIVGDIHGNYQLFCELLRKLGYHQCDSNPWRWQPPEGCVLVSVGDAVDRGTEGLATLQTLKHMVEHGHALFVLGNHEYRYWQMLRYELGLEKHPIRVSPSR